MREARSATRVGRGAAGGNGTRALVELLQVSLYVYAPRGARWAPACLCWRSVGVVLESRAVGAAPRTLCSFARRARFRVVHWPWGIWSRLALKEFAV